MPIFRLPAFLRRGDHRNGHGCGHDHAGVAALPLHESLPLHDSPSCDDAAAWAHAARQRAASEPAASLPVSPVRRVPPAAALLRLVACLLLAVLPLLAAGCSNAGRRVVTEEEAGKLLGSARVWYRAYPDSRVRGGITSSRAADLHWVMISRGHAGYAGRDALTLAQEEHFMRDDLMLELLSHLRDSGMYTPAGGALTINMRPEDYAETMQPRPAKWIASEHNGRITFLPFFVEDKGADAAARHRIFFQCERGVVEAYGRKEYKPGSSAVGSLSQQPRPTRPPGFED